MTSKTVVIAGASGVVGARALQHLLACDDVNRIVALGRRVLLVEHEKLVSRVVDLQSAEAMARALPDEVAVAICCLGTTMKQAGSREAFRAVDHDAVLAFGEAALRRGASRFVLVSTIGASPRARSFYTRTKGEAEKALARLGFAQLTVLRPSLIDDQGSRIEHRIIERIGLPLSRAIFSLAGRTSRYAPVPAHTIGKALVRLAFDETADRVRTIESDEIHSVGV